jgi:hypothetical protein
MLNKLLSYGRGAALVLCLAAAARPALAKCRDAYSSTYGAWGSARICYTPVGKGWYKTTVKGTIRDTRADKRRAALYVTYRAKVNPWTHWGNKTEVFNRKIAVAEHKGATRYGSWSRGRVREVKIHVCTTDRFGTTWRCGPAR